MMKSYLFIIALFMTLFNGPVLAEVDINTASAQELSAKLTNVGPAKAAAIIEYRETKGKFHSVDELMEVNGIGQATLEMNREVLSVDSLSPNVSDPAGLKHDELMTDIAVTERQKME